ncbi:hypothetical protein [Microbacterium xanthum]|uniref:hypothetical protein n=1 Tax=Microbacterium xanthum TaxID=3079794 RepID=UPI002AD36EAF|nr:hypothetical protein [Microbacterium sp. KSW-48]MDZ8171066.1 hypothetical protein [Microbacterium sp. KSW-48]
MDNEYFRGHLIDHAHGRIVFGIKGWRDAPSSTRERIEDGVGEFVACRWSRDRVRIDRDYFGNARLMHTSAKGVVAVSDSLLLLTSLRRVLSASVTPDEEVLAARAAPSQIAGQQISPRTMVREVSFVPPWVRIELCVDRLAVQEVTRSAASMLSAGESSVGADREVLRATAISMTRTAASLADFESWRSVIHLSGGLDSRAVFAAVHAASGIGEAAYISRTRSGAATERDNAVARRLAFEFGLVPTDIDKATAWPMLRPADGFRLWAAGLAGVYDGFGPLGPRRRAAHDFELFGLGAGAHKGAWGWRSLDAIRDAATHTGPVRDALDAQLKVSAAGLGVDAGARNASELYYFGYRNGLHSGAEHIGLHMTGISPLQNVAFAQLGHSLGPDGRFYGECGEGILSLTALLSPPAAVFEYDTPRHSWTLNDAVNRQRDLGGPLSGPETSPYAQFGDPERIPQGPSQLALAMARAAGFPDEYSSAAALRYSQENLELIAGPLVDIYREVIANARWRLSRSQGDLFAAELPLARSMMLGLFRAVS